MLALVAPVEHLHRDGAAEPEVLRAKHGRHAPGADAPLDLEALREDGARLHPPRIIAETMAIGALSLTRGVGGSPGRLGAAAGLRPEAPKRQPLA